MKQIIATSDDYGLTGHITDTILKGVDCGVLNRVSLMTNGLATDYALEEWVRRKDKLLLALHFNLVEGKCVANPDTIPNLVHANGTFRYSPIKLLLKSWFSSPHRRRMLKEDIRTEFRAQLEKIYDVDPDISLAINSHQHVHLVPLVFQVIVEEHMIRNFSDIRLPREPFFIVLQRGTFFGYIRHFGLNVLSLFSTWRFKKNAIPHPSFFVGTLCSGNMTASSVRDALSEVNRHACTSVEIGFHTGQASPNELNDWSGDIDWHYENSRERENELVQSEVLKELLDSFSQESFKYTSSRMLEIIRFIVSGGLAAVTNLVLLFVFTQLFGVWYVISAVCSYILSMVVSFSLQKFWTFSHHSLEKVHAEAALYTLNTLGGFFANIIGIYVLVEYFELWYLLAAFIMLVIVAVWNFFAYRFLIFQNLN